MKVAMNCLIALGAVLWLCPPAQAGGMKAAKESSESQDAQAMFEVQSHLRTAEDKILRLKEDAAKPVLTDRISAEDRGATTRDASKELVAAEKILGEAKGKLDAPKVRDFQKRIAVAKKDLATLSKPAAPKPPKK